MKNLQAYLNDESLKEKTIASMQVDIKAEALVKGHYWNGQNGCFVGCVIRGDSHADFELKLGIPRIIARLADRIFEGLPYDDAKKFSVDFLQAIKPGADLSTVWPKFAVFILIDKEYGVIKFAKKNKTKKTIQDIADLYQRIINGEKIDANTWLEARRNAAAAYAADAAAAYADAAAAAAAAYAAAADAAAAAAAYARSRHYVSLATALIKFLGEPS